MSTQIQSSVKILVSVDFLFWNGFGFYEFIHFSEKPNLRKKISLGYSEFLNHLS